MTAPNHTQNPVADRHVLDYELEDYVYIDAPQAMKAVADPTRTTILAMLLERAATTTQLADALGKPKGTIGYHLKVLEDASLVRVVRTPEQNVVVDITGKANGRGAYVCRQAACWEKGLTKERLAQALKVKLSSEDVAVLHTFLQTELSKV